MNNDFKRGLVDEFNGHESLNMSDHINPNYQAGRDFWKHGWNTPKTGQSINSGAEDFGFLAAIAVVVGIIYGSVVLVGTVALQTVALITPFIMAVAMCTAPFVFLWLFWDEKIFRWVLVAGYLLFLVLGYSFYKPVVIDVFKVQFELLRQILSTPLYASSIVIVITIMLGILWAKSSSTNVGTHIPLLGGIGLTTLICVVGVTIFGSMFLLWGIGGVPFILLLFMLK